MNDFIVIVIKCNKLLAAQHLAALPHPPHLVIHSYASLKAGEQNLQLMIHKKVGTHKIG